MSGSHPSPTKEEMRSALLGETGIGRDAVLERTRILTCASSHELWKVARELAVEVNTPKVPDAALNEKAWEKYEAEQAALPPEQRNCNSLEMVQPRPYHKVTGGRPYYDGKLKEGSTNAPARGKTEKSGGCDKSTMLKLNGQGIWRLLEQALNDDGDPLQGLKRATSKDAESGQRREKAETQIPERAHALRALCYGTETVPPFFDQIPSAHEQAWAKWKALLVHISFASDVIFAFNIHNWKIGLVSSSSSSKQATTVDDVLVTVPGSEEAVRMPRIPWDEWMPYSLHSREFRPEYKEKAVEWSKSVSGADKTLDKDHKQRGFPKGCLTPDGCLDTSTIIGRIWAAAAESFKEILNIEGVSRFFDEDQAYSSLCWEQTRGLYVLSKLSESQGLNPDLYNIDFFFVNHFHISIRRNTELDIKNVRDLAKRVGTGEAKVKKAALSHKVYFFAEAILPTLVCLELMCFFKERVRVYRQWYTQRMEEEGITKKVTLSDLDPALFDQEPPPKAPRSGKRKATASEEAETDFVFRQEEHLPCVQDADVGARSSFMPIDPEQEATMVKRFFPSVPKARILPGLLIRPNPYSISRGEAKQKESQGKTISELWDQRYRNRLAELFRQYIENNIPVLVGKRHDIKTAEQIWNPKHANNPSSSQVSKAKRLSLTDMSRRASDPGTALALRSEEEEEWSRRRISSHEGRVMKILDEMDENRKRGILPPVQKGTDDIQSLVSRARQLSSSLFKRVLYLNKMMTIFFQANEVYSKCKSAEKQRRKKDMEDKLSLLNSIKSPFDRTRNPTQEQENELMKATEKFEKAKAAMQESSDTLVFSDLRARIQNDFFYFSLENTPLAIFNVDGKNLWQVMKEAVPKEWQSGCTMIPLCDRAIEFNFKDKKTSTGAGGWLNAAELMNRERKEHCMCEAEAQLQSCVERISELKSFIEASKSRTGRALTPVALLLEAHTPNSSASKGAGGSSTGAVCCNPKGERQDYKKDDNKKFIVEYEAVRKKREGEEGHDGSYMKDMRDVLQGMINCVQQGFLHALRDVNDSSHSDGFCLHANNNPLLETASLFLMRMLSVARCFAALQDAEALEQGVEPERQGVLIVFENGSATGQPSLRMLDPAKFIESNNKNAWICFVHLLDLSMSYEPFAIRLPDADKTLRAFSRTEECMYFTKDQVACSINDLPYKKAALFEKLIGEKQTLFEKYPPGPVFHPRDLLLRGQIVTLLAFNRNLTHKYYVQRKAGEEKNTLLRKAPYYNLKLTGDDIPSGSYHSLFHLGSLRMDILVEDSEEEGAMVTEQDLFSDSEDMEE